MRVHGVGIDVVDIDRVQRLYATHGYRFVRKWFTPLEIDDAEAADSPALMYAARLAVKEATWKALGVQLARPRVPWRSILVVVGTRGPTARVELIGEMAVTASASSVDRVLVDYTIHAKVAVAIAIAIGYVAEAGDVS